MKHTVLFLNCILFAAFLNAQPTRIFERTFDFQNGQMMSATPEQVSMPDNLNIYKFQLGMKTMAVLNGVIYEVFADYNAITGIRRIFIRHTEDGIDWSAPVAVTPDDGISRYEASISIAVSKGPSYIAVCWTEYVDNAPGMGMAYSTDEGQTFSNPIVVVSAAGFQYINSTLVVDSNGAFYAIWCIYNGSWQNMHFSKSTDLGETWTPDQIVYSGFQYSSQPVAEVRGPGEVIFTFMDDQLFHTNSKVVFTQDGGTTWNTGAMTSYASGEGNTHWTTMAKAPNGDLYGLSFYYNTLGTEDSQEIQCARSTDFGVTWTDVTEVSDQLYIMNGWQSNTNTVMGAAVSENNVVYVVWSDSRMDYPNNNNFETYLSYSTDNGVTWSTDILVNEVTEGLFQSHAAVQVLSDGELDHVVVTWLDNRCFAPGIVQEGNTLMCTIPQATYQWYLNGDPINGATSQSYEIDVSGSYSVAVTDLVECMLQSEPIEATYIGLEEMDVTRMVVYPNPMQNAASVRVFCENCTISIADMSGRKIREFYVSSNTSFVLERGDMASGTYVMTVWGDQRRYNQLLIVD